MNATDDKPSVDEVGQVLAEIRGLNDGTIPESEQPRIMAAKRRLIEQLEPGFYDKHDGSGPVTGDALDAEIAKVSDTDAAGLVGLVRELADVLEVYAPHLDPAVNYRLTPPAPGMIYRDLDGGAGLVDLHSWLSPQALGALAEVLTATQDVVEATTVSYCRDEDCPECGWAETYTEVDHRGPHPGPVAIGCRKCGWRMRSADWAAARGLDVLINGEPGDTPAGGGE